MRYVTAIDIRNVRTRSRAYLYAVWYACNIYCDFKTKELKTTREKLAMELGVTIATLRHALKELEREGLISIEADRKGTIIRITEQVGIKPKAQNPTEKATEIREALPVLRKHADKVEECLKKKHGTLHAFFEPFSELQHLAGKAWHSEKDVVSHFVNWYIKGEKTDYAKRVKQDAAPTEPAPDFTQNVQRIGEEKEKVREEWMRQVKEARERGDEKFLNDKYTLIAIKRYGI